MGSFSTALGERRFGDHLLSRDGRETKQPIGSPCRLSRATHSGLERTLFSQPGTHTRSLETTGERTRDAQRHHEKPLPPTPKFGFGFASEDGHYGQHGLSSALEASAHRAAHEASRVFPCAGERALSPGRAARPTMARQAPGHDSRISSFDNLASMTNGSSVRK